MDKTKVIEDEYGKPMLDVLHDLASDGHNKTTAAKALGYTREHFHKVICKRYDPDSTVQWADPREAASKAQARRWGKQPMSNLPLVELREMVAYRQESPPTPYYVIAHAMGYHATSIKRWVDIYNKYGEEAFIKPRGGLPDDTAG